jgi:hypothetical protein
MTKKALFLRLGPKAVTELPKKVVLFPKKVDSLPKTVDYFPKTVDLSVLKKKTLQKAIFLAQSKIFHYLCRQITLLF